MTQLPTFDKLPEAVHEVNLRLERIEFLLLEKSPENHQELNKRLNIKQASEFINCAVSTVYGLVHNRIIPHEKKGKRLYFVQSELVEWLKKGKRPTIEEVKSKI